MRVLAVDPGDKRLGIALSDPTGSIARPLVVLGHVSRIIDAVAIAQLAGEHQASLIVVGQALDADNHPTPQSRRSARLAAAIREQTALPVVLIDESGSTQAAQATRLAMGVPHHMRRGHLDDLAAAILLQTYLDEHPPTSQGLLSDTQPENE